MLKQELINYIERMNDHLERIKNKHKDTEYGRGLNDGTIIAFEFIKEDLEQMIKNVD